jgi:hypothetical protein
LLLRAGAEVLGEKKKNYSSVGRKIEHLLCAVSWAGCWGYRGDQGTPSPPLPLGETRAAAWCSLEDEVGFQRARKDEEGSIKIRNGEWNSVPG